MRKSESFASSEASFFYPVNVFPTLFLRILVLRRSGAVAVTLTGGRPTRASLGRMEMNATEHQRQQGIHVKRECLAIIIHGAILLVVRGRSIAA